MRTPFLLRLATLLLSFFTVLPSQGLLMAQKRPVKKKNPYIAFTPDSIDIGRVQDTATVLSYTYFFQNISDKDIFIKNVRPDCACLEAIYNKQILKPGEEGSLSVSFLPYRPGPFDKKFMVTLTGTDTTKLIDSLSIAFKGYVEPADLAPELKYPQRVGDIGFRSSVIPLGNIEINQTVKRKIEFFNWGRHDINLLDSAVMPAHIGLAPDSTSLVKAGTAGAVWLFYKPETRGELGFLHDNFVLFTDSQSPTSLSFTVTAFVKKANQRKDKEQIPGGPLLEFSQEIVDFGKITSDSAYNQEVVLTNTGNDDLIISKTYAEYGCELSDKLEERLIKPGETITVSVKLQYIHSKHPIERKIMFFSNDATDPNKYLTIKARN